MNTLCHGTNSGHSFSLSDDDNLAIFEPQKIYRSNKMASMFIADRCSQIVSISFLRFQFIQLKNDIELIKRSVCKRRQLSAHAMLQLF